MTADDQKRVLLADGGPRADWLESQLQNLWGARVCRVVDLAQIKGENA